MPELEAQLQQFAASEGKDAELIVKETVARMLEKRAQFLAVLDQGISSADRGDLIDHDEVVARIEPSP